MSLLRILLASICFIPAGAPVQAQPFAPNVHRILFLGNSITYAGNYINDIETYFRLTYTARSFEFINAGLPSETVSGLSEEGHAGGKFPRPDLHERLRRVLAITKPDLVFACYGMNDGIYLPFDADRFSKFRQGIQWLHDTIIATGVPVVHLTPPVFDGRVAHNPAYQAVLDRYSDWLLSLRKKAGWQVIDIHYPMQRYLDEQRKTDTTFFLAADGIHPQETGHWLMAKEVLLYLKEKKVRALATLSSIIQSTPSGDKIAGLVAAEQKIMKDAWLTAAGHTRPGMTKGLPLAEAKQQVAALEAAFISAQ